MQVQQKGLRVNGDTLHGRDNNVLAQDEKLVSADKAHCLIMQNDGNLVCYRGNKPVWSSNTARKGCGPYTLVMQDDRNLVIYGAAHDPIWNTRTQGQGSGPARLVMQNDGNVVVYDARKKVLWHR